MRWFPAAFWSSGVPLSQVVTVISVSSKGWGFDWESYVLGQMFGFINVGPIFWTWNLHIRTDIHKILKLVFSWVKLSLWFQFRLNAEVLIEKVLFLVRCLDLKMLVQSFGHKIYMQEQIYTNFGCTVAMIVACWLVVFWLNKKGRGWPVLDTHLRLSLGFNSECLPQQNHMRVSICYRFTHPLWLTFLIFANAKHCNLWF